MKLFKNKSVEFVDSVKAHLFKKRIATEKQELFKLYMLKWLPILGIYLFMSGGLFKILFMALWWVFITIFFDHRDITSTSATIRIWFGVPGSGKTSIAAWLTRESIKRHYRVLSNVEIKGAYKLEEQDLGKYDMSFDDEGCHVVYDEATSNGLDNRDFKTFSSAKKKYFSLHRHMNNRVDVFSQDYDVDIKIKGRAGARGIFYLKRTALRGFVMYRRIQKIFFIRKEDKQFVDGFKFVGLPRICYTRSVWDSFDTLDKSLCPKEQKQWVKWYED